MQIGITTKTLEITLKQSWEKQNELKYNSEKVESRKDNLRSLCKIINQLVPKKEKDKYVYTKDNKSIANDFNTFFSTVGKNAARESTRLARIVTSTT